MKKKRTYTTDNSTVASNPGNVTLDPFVYIRFSPVEGVTFIFLFIISLAFITSFPYIFLFLIPFVFFWKHKQEHLKFGDSNPGAVIKINPTLVAIATDLRKRDGNYPVVKIIKVSLLNAKIGAKVGTVALYEGTPENIPYWSDFYPIVINCATSNLAEIEAAMESYTPKQFSDLEKGISQLQEPYREGLYKIHNEHSRW